MACPTCSAVWGIFCAGVRVMMTHPDRHGLAPGGRMVEVAGIQSFLVFPDASGPEGAYRCSRERPQDRTGRHTMPSVQGRLGSLKGEEAGVHGVGADGSARGSHGFSCRFLSIPGDRSCPVRRHELNAFSLTPSGCGSVPSKVAFSESLSHGVPR
jgi:hypothetical protein